MEQIYIYGDSLLKATVPDESFRYHFHLPEVMNWYPRERVAVTNRSKMGATSTKGLQLVEHDVARGMDARYALVAYGGCDDDAPAHRRGALSALYLPRRAQPRTDHAVAR